MAGIFISAQREDCVAWLKVEGRATFDVGDQLKGVGMFFLENKASHLKIDMAVCEFMDSTVMGVLAMLAIEGRKRKVDLTILNAGKDTLALLTGLGVDRVVRFDDFDTSKIAWQCASVLLAASVNSTTILDAHKTLMEIDDENVSRFDGVVKCLEAELGSSEESSD